jgi:predicted RNA-binding Zn-ribbon protein involved in translation (DUF1610 family)
LGTKITTVQSELEVLQTEKASSLRRAKQLDEHHGHAWKQEIAILANIIEKEYVLLEQTWLIPTICSEISRLYLAAGISIWQIVDRYIDARFKDENKARDQSSIPLRTIVPNYLEDSSSTLQELIKHIPDLPRSAMPELIEYCDKFVKGGRKRCALEHISLHPDDNASNIDQINDSNQQDREHITIDRPAPHGSLMYDAIGRKIERWKDVQERVFEFPPDILSKDSQYADALEAADIWMDPVLDLKYSKSLPDWLKAESYRDIFGKHAAGVMSYSVTNLCANCSNEKTKYWVRMEPQYTVSHDTYACLQCGFTVDTNCTKCNLPMRVQQRAEAVEWICPECDGNQPIKRNLTREQIGDKTSIIVDIAHKIAMSFPDCAVFYSWYHDWLERRLAGRKTRLSDDLSEHA